MGFTIEVGTAVNISDSRIGYDAPTAEYWDYFINPNNVSSGNVNLSILEAVVKIEDITAEWKFGTFTLSSLVEFPIWVLTNSTGWTTNTTTATQKIAVTGASLPIAIGEYIGFIVHANDSEYTYIAYTGSGTDSYVDTKNASYITTGTASRKAIGAIDVYGKYEYNHSNSDPIPQTSQSTGEVDKGDVYIGYGAIQLTDIQCTGTHKALFNLQTPWGDTHDSNILASSESVTKSRAISGGTEYYKITVSNIDCVNGDVTFTEQWWSDDGNRYVKTTGSDSALGTTWGVAWKTMGYGFQNIPSGKDLYVEEGYYGDETLSNLNPPQTMNMYIQPVGHTEAACEVHVFEHSVLVSNVDEDSWTKSTDPDSNFNGDSYLRIGVPSGQTRYSHLQFDISSLPSSPTLYSAIMRIYVAYESDRAIELRKESATFDETTITWNNKPASTNSTITQIITATGWIDLDITAILTAAFGNSTLGIEIRPTSSSGFSFGRHESGYGASLIIQYD